jgi:NAD(P)-dependent dehydrogenase (short-subunit alcohol dehydrogenase family)
MPGKLDGKVAIITGASANNGKAFAETLAQDGATIVVHYNSQNKEVEATKVAEAIKEAGGKAIVRQADLTKVAEIEKLVNDTIKEFGRWDILINTAGMIIRKPVAEFTEAEFDQLFAINAKIPFFLMREASKHMANEGRIVNMVTTILAVTAPTYAGYAGSKAPVEDFTRALAKEIGGRGITVNAVAPGPLKTSFFYPAETEQNIAWLKAQTISGDIGTVEDVVPLVRFLVSPEARWVTAQTMFVNGGMVAR